MFLKFTKLFGSLLEVNILNLWKYIVSEIYESPLTESRVYGGMDGHFTELSVYGDKFLKFMGIRVSQVFGNFMELSFLLKFTGQFRLRG